MRGHRLKVKMRGRWRRLPFTQRNVQKVQRWVDEGDIHFMDVDVE